eukprot:5527211-Amphidinium_carterae.1
MRHLLSSAIQRRVIQGEVNVALIPTASKQTHVYDSEAHSSNSPSKQIPSHKPRPCSSIQSLCTTVILFDAVKAQDLSMVFT